MWYLLLFGFFVSSQALMTYKPTIIDAYDLTLFNGNPYFNATVPENGIVYNVAQSTPIDVYNLELSIIKQIDEIDIECYDYQTCDTSITDRERKYLSLYASMLEVCGITSIPETYSIGILRNRNRETVVGQFSKTLSGTGELVHMAFWIRLEAEDHSLYDHLTGYPLTVAIMELAVHERSHYDVTSYNMEAGHCDEYQSHYNGLIRNSIDNLDKFDQLTTYIMGPNTYSMVIIFGFCAIGIIAVVVFGIIQFRKGSKEEPLLNRRDRLI